MKKIKHLIKHFRKEEARDIVLAEVKPSDLEDYEFGILNYSWKEKS